MLCNANIRQLFAFILIFFLCVPAYSGTNEWEYFQKHSSSYVTDLASSAEKCIQNHDTKHPVFHGCIDWHSAVHGHWALIRAYRKTKNTKFLTIAISSMNEDAMHKEFLFLKANPAFEMPYGRSWFLKLMSEYEIVTKRKDFRSFSDFVAQTLLDYLLNQPFNPAVREYNNISWALINLLNYYDETNNLEKVKIIKQFLTKETENFVSLKSDHENADFFSLWGNLAYLYSNVLPKEDFTKWLEAQHITSDQLEPIIEVSSNHHLSINYSRAWGFWSVFRITGDSQYRKAYIKAINSSLSIHKKYRGNYYAYGHWVPQFGILAITISEYE